ncbi:hypothetical protein [Conexibacter stalactiti]|nr:hypothetical protein [Conexibacter stalactiti]
MAETLLHAEDPTRAFEEMLYAGIESVLEDRSLIDMANSRYVIPEIQQHIGARVLEQIKEPLRLAQEADRVRAIDDRTGTTIAFEHAA